MRSMRFLKFLRLVPFLFLAVFLEAPLTMAADFVNTMQNGLFKMNSLETEHFQIEFSDLTLAQTDSDGDEISDVIETVAESVESSWDIIIDEMGYEEPMDDPIFKVMVILDDNYEYVDENTMGITSVLSNGEPYIAIDPWMDELDLIVTAGHEFYHAVQFGYDVNFAYTYQGINWAEASATWMEDQLFDDINDYVSYMPDFFDYPDYSIFASIIPTDTLFEYGLSIWPRFLSEYLEGRNHVIKDIWETYFDSSTDYESDLKLYEAVKAVLEDRGVTLEDAYQEFSLWNLDLSNYEEGELYPGVYFVPDTVKGEYTQIPQEYAPALYGTNYLYFENTYGEENFYFHLLKADGLSYALSLVPYVNGEFASLESEQIQLGKDEEMSSYLSIQNADKYDGIVAVVSSLEKDFEDGFNWEVFDEGYYYYYLGEYADDEEGVEVIMENESDTEIDQNTEGKEGDEVAEEVTIKEGGLTLTLIDYDQDSVTFSWNRLDDENLAGYELHYGTKSGDYDFIEEIEKDYTTKASVKDLEEGISYYFELQAIDAEGDAVDEPSSELTVTTAEWLFEDVSYLHENYASISALVEEGIFKGYTDGTFRPTKDINRAELLKILIEGRNVEYDPSLNKNCFPDVHEEWFAEYVCYAKYRQWVEGYSDGTFRPSDPVNKVEALKIMFNVYEAGLIEGAKVAKLNYSDLNTNAWYAIYVWKASMLGILEEDFGGKFNPDLDRTRGDMAEELYRYLVVLKELKVQ